MFDNDTAESVMSAVQGILLALLLSAGALLLLWGGVWFWEWFFHVLRWPSS